jgi:hypothetical protein
MHADSFSLRRKPFVYRQPVSRGATGKGSGFGHRRGPPGFRTRTITRRTPCPAAPSLATTGSMLPGPKGSQSGSEKAYSLLLDDPEFP